MRRQGGGARQLEIPDFELERNGDPGFLADRYPDLAMIHTCRCCRRHEDIDPDRLRAAIDQLEWKGVAFFISIAVNAGNERVWPLAGASGDGGWVGQV